MTAPAKYRKKPVTIEAVQWHADRGAYAAIAPIQWVETNGGKYRIDAADAALYIVTLEGEMRVNDGDYIIRGVQGEFYPCKPDIFAATHMAEEDTPELLAEFDALLLAKSATGGIAPGYNTHRSI